MDGKAVKPIAVLELLTGFGIMLFWIGFFTVGLAPAEPPACYFAFEHSFPLPDTILALGLVTSAVLLLKGKTPGRSVSLVCAGGLMFLGLVDFSFNILNGMYAISVMDTILNAFINLWCAAFGLFIAVKLAGV